MLRAENRDQLDTRTRDWRLAGLRIALVPTMGNLHEGHLALVRAARETADRVITSIYVNPAQFGEGEDFQRYPRTLDSDLESLEEAGCDLVFVPDDRTMYPNGLENAVRLLAAPDLASVLEGASRPGHFDGVVTVVARLFNLARPDAAVFGEKDYQQLLVIRRMVEDLAWRIRIVPVPTVREDGGLAMSSRNHYLAEEERDAAGRIHAVLRDAALRVDELLTAADSQAEAGKQDSPCSRSELIDVVERSRLSPKAGAGKRDSLFARLEAEAAEQLSRYGLKVDYVAVRRARDLDLPRPGDSDLRILAAAWSGPTRLIDNLPINKVGISPQ